MRTRVCTNAYAAKREIFARLREFKADPDGPMRDWLLSYRDPGKFGEGQMLYGGGAVFDQAGEEDAVDGDDTLTKEVAVIGLHIRVELAPTLGDDVDPVEFTDEIAEGMGDTVAQLFAEDPRLAGGQSITRIVGGQCDHGGTDTTVISVLTLRVSVESYI
jgi:hypothetical protein